MIHYVLLPTKVKLMNFDSMRFIFLIIFVISAISMAEDGNGIKFKEGTDPNHRVIEEVDSMTAHKNYLKKKYPRKEKQTLKLLWPTPIMQVKLDAELLAP